MSNTERKDPRKQPMVGDVFQVRDPRRTTIFRVMALVGSVDGLILSVASCNQEGSFLETPLVVRDFAVSRLSRCDYLCSRWEATQGAIPDTETQDASVAVPEKPWGKNLGFAREASVEVKNGPAGEVLGTMPGRIPCDKPNGPSNFFTIKTGESKTIRLLPPEGERFTGEVSSSGRFVTEPVVKNFPGRHSTQSWADSFSLVGRNSR